jgi:DNA-binding CsgD family transcriptional regulator
MLLSPRQRQIVALVGNGENLQEIASSISYSYATVRKDIEETKKKLNASTLANIVVMAIVRGEVAIAADGVVEPTGEHGQGDCI